MVEVRIHGRGGQGNVVAAYLLAGAAIFERWHALAFPAFGAERRGAPVASFVRMDRKPFRRRDQIASPDFLIVQDRALLLHVSGIAAGLKSDGSILVNSPDEVPWSSSSQSIYPLPATRLALKYLGRPVPNTALLAAFIQLTQLFPLEALDGALARRFEGKLLESNRELIRAVADMVPAGAWREMKNAAAS